MKSLIIVMTLWGTVTHAEGLSFGLSQTIHVGMEENYRESHVSVRYQHDNFIVGAYHNSMNEVSVYAGVKFQQDSLWVELGGVTGYLDMDVAPMLRVGYDLDDQHHVFAAPALEADHIGLVLGIGYSF